MKKPIVVNLFGGPGTGKSTGAAYVFSMLKMQGINCELVTEFAKDKTWEHNMTALGNQAYVFGKQSYRMSRCINQVDVIITDSPLLLSLIYNSNLGQTFNNMVLEIFNSYNNLNFLLTRTKPYNPIGRNQTEKESDDLSHSIKSMLVDNHCDITHVTGDIQGYNAIVDAVLSEIKSC